MKSAFVALLPALFLLACSMHDSTSSANAGGGSDSGTAGAGGAANRRQPPPVGSAAIPGSLLGQAFATPAWNVGEPSGTWASYGFAWSTGKPCRTKTAAEAGVVDNAFGRSLSAKLQTVLGALASATSGGTYAYVLSLLPDTRLLPASVGHSAAGDPIPPTQDEWTAGTYAWHPLSASTNAARFGASGYAGGSVVATGDITLILFFEKAPLRLTLRRAVLAGELAEGTVTAQIGGVIPVSQLGPAIVQAQLHAGVAGCYPLPDVAAAVAEAADMLADGAVDPTRDCDAISFGAGAVMRRAQLAAPTEDFHDLSCAQQ